MVGPKSRPAWLVTLIVLPVAVVGCGQRNAYVPPPPPKVTIAQPIVSPVVEHVDFTGTTHAFDHVDLRSRVNGYLKEVKFTDGTRVKKDQLLFVIEREPFEVDLKSAQAALAKAKANAELAQTQLSRSERLAATNSISREELDIQLAQKNSAAAEVATAEANVKRAELSLSHTEIRAPWDGRIGRHLVDVGNLVQAEITPLAVIEASDPIYVHFNISEPDLLRFMELVRTKVIPDPDKQPPVLYLGLANENGFPHEGRLDFRDLSVDPETGTILRRGVFPNADGFLVPGLFARIRAPIGKAIPKLLIEERAVCTDQRGDFVLVVNKDGVVEYRPVRLGVAEGGRRVVEEGLQAEEWVIVNGLQRARPGTKVEALRAVAEGGDAAKDAAATSQPAAPSTTRADK